MAAPAEPSAEAEAEAELRHLGPRVEQQVELLPGADREAAGGPEVAELFPHGR